MPTPHLIALGTDHHIPIATQSIGPFEIGTDLYCALIVYDPGGGSPSTIGMYCSTNTGTTWTLKDSANSPIIPELTWKAQHNWLDVVLSSSTLHVAHSVVGTHLGGTALFMAASAFTGGTWTGTPVVGPLGGMGTNTTNTMSHIVRSDNTQLFLYDDYTPVSTNSKLKVWGVEFDGASSWGTSFVVETRTHSSSFADIAFLASTKDSYDNAYVFSQPVTPLLGPGTMVDGTLHCCVVDSTNSITTTNTISTDLTLRTLSVARPVTFNNLGIENVAIAYPYTIRFTQPVDDQNTQWVGLEYHLRWAYAATGTAPTFTTQEVSHRNSLEADWYQLGMSDTALTIGGGGIPRVAWLAANFKRWSYFSTDRSARGIWHPRPRVGYSVFGDGSSPVNKLISAITGNYIPSRNVHGYIIQIESIGGDPGIYYIENT